MATDKERLSENKLRAFVSDPPPADYPERKTHPMSSGMAGSPLTLQNPAGSSDRPNFSPASSQGTANAPNIWMPDSPGPAGHPQTADRGTTRSPGKSNSSPLTDMPGGYGPLNTVKRFMGDSKTFHASNNSMGSTGLLGSVTKENGPPQPSARTPKHRIGGSIEMANMTRRRRHHPTHSRDLSAQLFINLTDEVEQQQEQFPDKPYYRELNTEIPWYLNVAQSRWTLRFREKDQQSPRADPRDDDEPGPKRARANHYASVENWFNTDRFKKSRKLVRAVCLILVCVVVAQIVSDNCDLWDSSLCIRTKSKFKNRQFILWFFTFPLSVLWFWSSFQDFYMNNLNWVPPIFALGYGVSYTLVTAVAEKADNASMMTFMFCVWMFLRIPFFTAFMVTWPVVIGFVLVIRFTEVYPKNYEATDEFDPRIEEALDAFYLLVTNAFLTYAAYSLERTERSEFIDTLEKDHTKQNTQDLLNNLIPQEIQVRIREQMGGSVGQKEEAMRQIGQGAIADERSDVSVLFSDLVGFTKYCSKVHATTVVRALNSLYFEFDAALEKLNVFKVETIGDAYFVSSNCPIPSEDHAERLVLLGERMIEACANFVPENAPEKGYKFKMRIGVHSGKVFAGVVGYKMPRYHLFGKTVTIAEQMESNGVPGRVQISEDTKRYLDKWTEQSKKRLRFGFQRRDEPIEVAGGQMMKTYLITFRNPAPSSRRQTNSRARASVESGTTSRRKERKEKNA